MLICGILKTAPELGARTRAIKVPVCGWNQVYITERVRSLAHSLTQFYLLFTFEQTSSNI